MYIHKSIKSIYASNAHIWSNQFQLTKNFHVISSRSSFVERGDVHKQDTCFFNDLKICGKFSADWDSALCNLIKIQYVAKNAIFPSE